MSSKIEEEVVKVFGGSARGVRSNNNRIAWLCVCVYVCYVCVHTTVCQGMNRRDQSVR